VNVFEITLVVCAYPYALYPALLGLLASLRPPRPGPPPMPLERWPAVSICIPVYNEAAVIAATLEAILEIDYPAESRQIVVISDASTDDTDAIVARFAARGVTLIRIPERRGKTAAENAARSELVGEIVVNTDASVRVHPAAIKHLVAALADPGVGLASARDVSVARLDTPVNAGEAAYVGYEMWVRDLETTISGIVGASGCLYAIRAILHAEYLPEALSRDFAATLVTRERGYRAVSVPEAICYVPRSASLRQEYRRKVRTMSRGLATLLYKRRLLDPFRFGAFAWMLASHKLLRWLVPWAAVVMMAALALAAPADPWARRALVVAGALGVAAALGWLWPEGRRMPRLLAVPAFAAGGIVAALHAWMRVLARRKAPTWEPTRRATVITR
jgi:cellulose synthase/poly-beta-1,6-N-acetylglucosamine synthase-like glycosyltransferase